MKIQKIYIDTSVFGGYFDEEFEKYTKLFFEKIFSDNSGIIVSDILELELYRAPLFVREFYQNISDGIIHKVFLTEDVADLARKYIAERVVGKTSLADCQHIALATIYGADVLVSWNFKHIVNLERIRGYNSTNFREGYQILEIRTPKEIFDYE